jgi:cysteinyl-tRNA synthetase
MRWTPLPRQIPEAWSPNWACTCYQSFKDAVNDDLNIPEAFAALFTLVHESNKAMHNKELDYEKAMGILGLMKKMDEVLGVIDVRPKHSFIGSEALLDTTENGFPPDIVTLINARTDARKAKNWAESDRLRDELAAKGWEIRDSKDGQKVKRK